MFLKEELEQAIEELPDNYRTARRKLREDYQPQISEINKQMIELKGEIGTLKTALVQTGVDVGPVIYLARTFDTDVDTVVKFFIFVLIFVFDPMAVMFVISYNVALQHTKEEKVMQSPSKGKKKRWWEMYKEGERPPTAHELMMGKKEEPIELKADSKDLPNVEEKKQKYIPKKNEVLSK